MIRRKILLQLYCHKGFSILEVVAIVVILGTVLTSLIPSCVNRINRAKYEKMITEMTSIAQASIDYHNSQYPYAWPTLSQLVPNTAGSPNYLYHAVTKNPWGNNYSLSEPQNGLTNLVIVSADIPAGIAEKNPEGSLVNIQPGTSNDHISIAISIPNEGIGRLQYEKKYTYNQ